MTANLYDHSRRLVDLEVALTGLVRALSEAGHAGVGEHAIRKAYPMAPAELRNLLQGDRVNAADRRS